MERPFFPTARSDAPRSLAMADTLLEARDLLGSRSFAQSARDANPSLDADQIIAIADTLLGAERRLVNNQPDWVAVLHLTPLEGLDAGLVSGRFHRLRSLLDPRTNGHPFAEQAFNLIHEAYPVLINPASPSWRSLFDAHLGFYSQQPISLFGGGGGVAQQQLVQVHQHLQPKVEPVDDDGSTLQTHNFMGLPSGSNSEFGSGSSSSSPGHVQLHDFLNVSDEVINASENVDAEKEDEDKVEEEARKRKTSMQSSKMEACSNLNFI